MHFYYFCVLFSCFLHLSFRTEMIHSHYKRASLGTFPLSSFCLNVFCSFLFVWVFTIINKQQQINNINSLFQNHEYELHEHREDSAERGLPPLQQWTI